MSACVRSRCAHRNTHGCEITAMKSDLPGTVQFIFQPAEETRVSLRPY
jgi:hypothetical protein